MAIAASLGLLVLSGSLFIAHQHVSVSEDYSDREVHQIAYRADLITPTLIPSSTKSDWVTYVDSKGRYSISFPRDWVIHVAGGKDGSMEQRVEIYYRTASGEPGDLYILKDGGGADPLWESPSSIDVVEQEVTIGRQRFKKRVFRSSGKNTYISLTPTDLRGAPITYVGGNIPSTNEQKYLPLLDEVLGTLTFP